VTEPDRPISDHPEAQVTRVKRRYGRVRRRTCLAVMWAIVLITGPRTLASASSDAHRPLATTNVHRLSQTEGARALTRLLISDMSQPSERMPQGVPSWYDWARGPRARPLAPLRSFQAFTSWGQLYQCAGTRPAPGEAVELRDLQTWVLLRGSRRWRRIQFSSDLEGAAFAEDYQGPTLRARYVPTPAETTVQPISGHNFHFWPGSGRVSLLASQVLGVIVSVRARLRSTGPPGTPTPCLVLSVGGDMWRWLGAQPITGASGDVGIGRFKRLERRWRLFTMSSAPAGLLKRFPLASIAPAAEDF
jgi:hypothetical protein